jgi:hypothetical protein
MGRCKRLRRSERIADVAGNGTPAAVIAALLDPARQFRDGRHAGVKGDGCGLSRRVWVDSENTRPAAQGLLDDEVLAAPIDPARVENRRLPSVRPRYLVDVRH